MSTSNDGSESVDQFLARIASVKEGRDEAATTRRMDEEFLKGRQERQARRLERARSISPSKTGPAKTSSLSFDSPSTIALNAPVDLSPEPKSIARSNAISGRLSPTRDGAQSPTRALPSPVKVEDSPQSQSTVTGLARSGTLSWQQRPASRDGSRQRPVSGFASVRDLPAPQAQAQAQAEKQEELSRADIAASLAKRDPAWFRQTQDRGQGSAAFRKNQVEDTSAAPLTRSMQLPGMSQSRESPKTPVPESRNPRSPPPASLEVGKEMDRFKRGTTPDIVAMRNSMVEKPPSLRPTSQDSSVTQPTGTDNLSFDDSTSSLARAPSTMSQNRPASPTKGLGGFVESAMMKRSDSVSKRWSVKAGTGLKRGDSVAGGRPVPMHARGISKDLPSARGDTPSSPLTSSRPGSSHNHSSSASPQLEGNGISGGLPGTTAKDVVVDSSKPTVSQATETAEKPTRRPQTPTEDSQLARSPSKTMDPRRWSPTKSTWLESALSQKPEPPKLQPLKEEQPKWKVDLQRSRSRASRDVSPEKQPQRDGSVPSLEALVSSPAAVPEKLSPAPASEFSSSSPTSKGTVNDAAPQDESRSSASEAVTTAAMKQNRPAVESSSLFEAVPVLEAQKTTIKKVVSEPSRQPPSLKPKPQTPPKTDFRATLKSRAAGPAQNDGAEPEFRSVFGKLKRATTQNYVAPDELKTNIMTGKAALNATGGPVKSKRVDEFKESILAKKEEMKTPAPKPVSKLEMKEKADEPIPEALARRKTLSKANKSDLSHLESGPQNGAHPNLTPQAMPKPLNIKAATPSNEVQKQPMTVVAVKQESPKPVMVASQPLEEVSKPKVVETSKQAVQSASVKSQTTFSSKPSQTSLRSSKTSVQLSASKTEIDEKKPESSTPILEPEANIAVTSGLPAGSKLASRLNANLAAVLTRSSQASPNASTETLSLSRAVTRTDSEPAMDESLTHMTKGRAKGPKRRAPKTEVTDSVKVPLPGVIKQEPLNVAVPPRRSEAEPSNPVQKSEGAAAVIEKSVKSYLAPSRELVQPKTPVKQDISTNSPFLKQEQGQNATQRMSVEEKPKPMVASKSPDLRKISSSTSLDEKRTSGPAPITPRKPSFPPASKSSPRPQTPPSSGSIKQSKQGFNKVEVTSLKQDEEKLVKPEAKPTPAAKPAIQGLGLKLSRAPQASKVSHQPRVLTPPPETAVYEERQMSQAHIKSVLEGYVGNIARDNNRADFDVHQFLTSAQQIEGKIKTTHHTVYEMSGDGKKSTMPSQQQHILYEDAMYVVTHKFITENGSSTAEVHLWCGDRVSDAAVQDAQIFCRKDARDHGAKLEIVKQGKESSSFLQGFGGILITRRSKSSALYMLCGRRHLGHIVFDEVEMESSSLCPGYPFLISASFGKLFLWKGRGSGADEIGSARLVGADLGLSGEIEEIDQGTEPPSFWEAVGAKGKTEWSDDWQRRVHMKGFPTVMYRVEHERPGMLSNLTSWGLKRAASPAKQQVKAVCERLQPFSQDDLEHPAIHILDAYRTLYIVLTDRCASKAAEFVTALYLAQDFAMLSPAIQDRPTLPTCYVVVGDLPNDVKACFRKWSAVQGNSLAGKESICVRLEEAMKALDL